MGAFVPWTGQEEYDDALEYADKAQDAAKAATGKNQLRVYYPAFVHIMREANKPASEWIAPPLILQPFTASDGSQTVGCSNYLTHHYDLH